MCLLTKSLIDPLALLGVKKRPTIGLLAVIGCRPLRLRPEVFWSAYVDDEP